MKPKNNLVGFKFGKLTVLEWVENPNKNNREKYLWKCSCDCGNICYRITYKLKAGISNSCGCLQKEILLSKQKENGLKRRKGISAVGKQIYNGYIRNAKKDKREFSLSYEDVIGLIHKPCHYCGEIDVKIGFYLKDAYFLNGIDRVDSSKGYTLENTVPCCKKCNISKHNYTQEEFLEHIKKIYKYSIKD